LDFVVLVVLFVGVGFDVVGYCDVGLMGGVYECVIFFE